MSIKRHFMDLLGVQHANRRFVCVGLDSNLTQVPESARRGDVEETMVHFTCSIVDSTAPYAGCFKPNAAFYEGQGDEGWRALKRIMNHIHRVAPEIPVILDAKRGDIGNTNSGYVQMAFDWLGVDAMTVQPFLGGESLEPLFSRPEKGIIVLCKTSNPGAGEFQDRLVDIDPDELQFLEEVGLGSSLHMSTSQGGDLNFTEMYKLVALRVARDWNKNGNCGVVVGATYPDELKAVRQIVGDMPILIPGIGAQGGDLEKTVEAGKDSRGRGMIINSSRGIIFASSGPDFAEAAGRETQKLHDAIQECLSVLAPTSV